MRLITIIAAPIILASAAIFVPSTLKKDPDFCRSCHLGTQKLHQQKYDSAAISPMVALAGPHFAKKVYCVSCHDGTSLMDKIDLRIEEIKNTGIYFFMKFKEPAKLDKPFPDDTCIACHDKYRPGSKFHNLPAHRGRMPIPCADCHITHKKPSEPTGNASYFLDFGPLMAKCKGCHPSGGEKYSSILNEKIENY